jgi:uncharacterized protein (UPF0332 family)
MERAKETYREVEVLINNALYNGAVNRLYYACFYAVTALLIKNEIDTQTHAGVRQMFGLNFIKTGKIDPEIGKFYSAIFNSRQTGDYDDLISFDEERITVMLEPARQLISEIENLLKN